MQLSPSGKLFLADQRGVLETPTHRRYCTFAFGSYAHAHKQPFGRLHALNEETLAGGQVLALPVPAAAQVLVLPITGAVRAGTAPGEAALVEVEELLVLSVNAGDTVRFTNPYPTELICFLHMWLAPSQAGTPAAWAFDVAGRAGQLVEACPVASALPARGGAATAPFRVRLGYFAGRAEAVCTVAAGHPDFFAFVLAGAFEIEGRLLHAGDGLALCGTPVVALEALSNHAVVITLELAAPAPG